MNIRVSLILDFSIESINKKSRMDKDDGSDENGEKDPEVRLRKVKHMQKIMEKEGISSKTMNENIEAFEDVPAYIRRNRPLPSHDTTSDCKPSTFTLTSDETDGPVFRNNNAYLNDAID